MFGCKDSILQVKGKVNNVTNDKCTIIVNGKSGGACLLSLIHVWILGGGFIALECSWFQLLFYDDALNT
ncbi:putative adenylate cyclase-associated CAP superfamily [Helianthus debilis subsp. tardiflorus]